MPLADGAVPTTAALADASQAVTPPPEGSSARAAGATCARNSNAAPAIATPPATARALCRRPRISHAVGQDVQLMAEQPLRRRPHTHRTFDAGPQPDAGQHRHQAFGREGHVAVSIELTRVPG